MKALKSAHLYLELITPELWSELNAENLVRDDAPVPA